MDGIYSLHQEINGFIKSLIRCRFFDKITKGLVYVLLLMFPGNTLGSIHDTTEERLLRMYVTQCFALPHGIGVSLLKLSPKDVQNLE